MAEDIFAKIGDIKGESTDDKHKDEIEVLSYSWGVANTPPTGPGGAGKAVFQDVTVVHGIDKSTPSLFKVCAREFISRTRRSPTARPDRPDTNT